MRELRVALIGGGFMGRAHSLAYGLVGVAEDVGARIVKDTLVDVSADAAAAAAEQLGWKSSSDNWREVVTRDDIDIVDICTPPDLHEEIATVALANGKHVFCEKPIANDLASAQRMAKLAREAGTVAQVGFNYRHAPAISYAKQLLTEGRLGKPLQFRATYLGEALFTADPNRWRAKRSTGGSGMVGDIGSHVIDIAEYLYGPIDRVCALVRAKGQAPGEGWISEADRVAEDVLDDAGVWIAEFENGALGSFAVNAFSSGHMNQVYFAFDGSLGAVEFDWNRREEFRVSYVNEEPDHHGFRTIHTNDHHPDGWWRLAGLGTGYVDITTIQFQHFVRSIVNGVPVKVDFGVGARVEAVVEAVSRSAVSGQWESVQTA